VGPGLAFVFGLVDAVAGGLFAGAGVEDFGVGGGDGEGADGGYALLVEDRLPDVAGVGGLPDAATGCAEVVYVGVVGNAGDGGDTSAAEGTDEEPLEGFQAVAGHVLSSQRENCGEQGDGQDGQGEVPFAGREGHGSSPEE